VELVPSPKSHSNVSEVLDKLVNQMVSPASMCSLGRKEKSGLGTRSQEKMVLIPNRIIRTAHGKAGKEKRFMESIYSYFISFVQHSN
jgi:hypothetical protein